MTETHKVSESTAPINGNAGQRKHSGVSVRTIIIIFVLALLVVAVIKNPSQSESRDQVKNYLVERISNGMMKDLASDSKIGTLAQGLGNLLINAFAPSAIDSMLEIRTNDYIAFSTFSVESEIIGERLNLMSGVILFGKIIPLSSDVDRDKLDELSDKAPEAPDAENY